MSDLENAKIALNGHTIALCKGDKILTSEKKGITPMVEFIDSGINLKGYSVADLIVGKAVAMLYVKAGIVAVYAKTISKPAIQILKNNNISFCYDIFTDKIINRKGNDLCPMEKVVLDIDNVDIAYHLIKSKLNELKHNK